MILAVPMICMSLSRMLMGFIDFVMVSWLGTEAQAAVSPASLLIFALSCFGMGAVQSVQTFVSQADGRGEPERAGAYAWQSLFMAGLWTILTLPIVLTTATWFRAFGLWAQHPSGVLEMEIEYLVIALWSVAPAIACAGLDGFYNGIRRPAIPLVGVIVSLVVNGVGNYVLILGEWGFPKMGIAGAALATVIGWMARFVILLVPLFWPSIDARYHTWRGVRLKREQFVSMVRLGVPIAMQWLLDIGAWVVFLHVIMPPYGAATLAASNIALQYMHLSFMPAIGVGMAMLTQVGNAIGAGNPDEAVFRMKVARRVIISYMLVMGAVFILLGRPLTAVFNADAAVIAAGIPILIWAGLFQPFDGMCITYSFALRGAGDSHVPAALFGICCWGIFIGGGWLLMWLAPHWGFNAPWAMCAAYIIVLGPLLWWRFSTNRWRAIQLFKEAPPAIEPAGDVAVAAALEPVAVGSR